jgi:hypothetical protein
MCKGRRKRKQGQADGAESLVDSSLLQTKDDQHMHAARCSFTVRTRTHLHACQAAGAGSHLQAVRRHEGRTPAGLTASRVQEHPCHSSAAGVC